MELQWLLNHLLFAWFCPLLRFLMNFKTSRLLQEAQRKEVGGQSSVHTLVSMLPPAAGVLSSPWPLCLTHTVLWKEAPCWCVSPPGRISPFNLGFVTLRTLFIFLSYELFQFDSLPLFLPHPVWFPLTQAGTVKYRLQLNDVRGFQIDLRGWKD